MEGLFIRIDTDDDVFNDLTATASNEDPAKEEQHRKILQELYDLSNKKLDETKIKEQIEKIAENFKYPYLDAVKTFLELSDNRRQFFNNVFFADFYDAKQIDYIAVKCLEYEGLIDRLIIDSSTAKIEKIWADSRGLFHLAQTNDPILIVGETGTGKELLARSVHKMSKARKTELVEINCSAIPTELLEGELFGWEKGAHSKAEQAKKGLIEMANEGTLFLDEIGKMPKNLQAKLLKVVEEKKFYRLGALVPTLINVRFIAAGQPRNIDKTDISKSDIYDDLLYRLGYPDIIKMPTLNQTIHKIKDAFGYTIVRNATIKILKKMDLQQILISTDVIKTLFGYKYMGNYRELENILRSAIRSAITNGRKEVLLEDLSFIDNQQSEFNTLNDYIHAYKEIKLKDIINFANEFRDLLVITKYEKTLQDHKDLKSAFLSQGLHEKEYQNLWKKFNAIRKRTAERKTQNK